MQKQNSKLGPVPFKARILEELGEMIKEQPWCNPDRFNPALNALLKALGAEADLPTDRQTPESFARARAFIMDSGLTPDTASYYGMRLRPILERLVPAGLKKECVAEITRMRRPRIHLNVARAPRISEMKTILGRLQFAIKTVQILLWLALPRALYLVDAVLLEFATIEWNTGMISFRRAITGEIVTFAALPPLLELLKERKECLGPDAIYVFPELLFTNGELADPVCNTVRWETVPKNILARAAIKGRSVVNEFLGTCGFKNSEITYKSIRLHQISFWSAVGINMGAFSHTTGQGLLHNHDRTPTEFEIVRMRDITWEYLQAVVGGRPFFIPTTLVDVYDAVGADIDQAMNEQRLVLDQLLDQNRLMFEQLRKIIASQPACGGQK